MNKRYSLSFWFPLLTAVVGFSLNASAQIVVQTSEYILPSERTNFVDFSGVSTNNPVYIQDGVQTSALGNSPYGYNDGQGSYFYFQGSGIVDQITLTNGGEFGDVGLMLGTGFYAGSYGAYKLLDHGNVVLTGNIGPIAGYGSGFNPQFLGFSGGGFDTILLSDNAGGPSFVGSGDYSAIEIASIENRGTSSLTPVPEPSTYAAAGVGALSLMVGLKRRKSRRVSQV